MALRDDPSSYSTLSTVMPSSVSADIAVPRKSQRPKKRDASSALLPRQTNVPVADAATSTEPIQQAGGRETYGGTCLFLCIAMAVSATLVVLIAASVALLCGRPWFKCKRCVTDNLSAAEEQKWPISSMKTYEGCPPWLLSIPEQPQQQAEQQQCLASQQEQSWSPVTTLANGQNDVVSPMDFQTWNGSQHTYQVSPTTTQLSPLVHFGTNQSHQGHPEWQYLAELPTTPDRGTTPLPSYPAAMADAHLPPRFSWTGEEEASYRPSSWMKR
ncbi:hypothetical protein ED733_001654 [Metarhizium rileyi]|uniref:Uncharacterized protein n=1 Tax=Metarhizium rileyi (strain RCEF 4871) TaxID=1649241 RepID=A0A5C6GA00_METRR|nr:hypothetical protein ED733_001654 [Metarhizium rileyi]